MMKVPKGAIENNISVTNVRETDQGDKHHAEKISRKRRTEE
jgi:hypothetical protein